MSGWAALADCIQSLQPKHLDPEFLPVVPDVPELREEPTH